MGRLSCSPVFNEFREQNWTRWAFGRRRITFDSDLTQLHIAEINNSKLLHGDVSGHRFIVPSVSKPKCTLQPEVSEVAPAPGRTKAPFCSSHNVQCPLRAFSVAA